MKVVVRDSAEEVARLAAGAMAATLRRRPDAVLGLATGRTMERVYAELVRLHGDHGLDFAACRTVNLDEYIGLDPADPACFGQYMRRHLFGLVNVAPANTHIPDGSAPDSTAEARRYEDLLERLGGVDLQILGIGETGHIGFNEPLTALTARTHDVTLAPATRRQNVDAFGGEIDRVPTRAITMGTGTILEARRILLIATGESKAAMLAQALEGPLSARVSCSALQLHQDCLVLADEAAASRFAEREYYEWLVRHDPHLIEWLRSAGAAGPCTA